MNTATCTVVSFVVQAKQSSFNYNLLEYTFINTVNDHFILWLNNNASEN